MSFSVQIHWVILHPQRHLAFPKIKCVEENVLYHMEEDVLELQLPFSAGCFILNVQL